METNEKKKTQNAFWRIIPESFQQNQPGTASCWLAPWGESLQGKQNSITQKTSACAGCAHNMYPCWLTWRTHACQDAQNPTGVCRAQYPACLPVHPPADPPGSLSEWQLCHDRWGFVCLVAVACLCLFPASWMEHQNGDAEGSNATHPSCRSSARHILSAKIKCICRNQTKPLYRALEQLWPCVSLIPLIYRHFTNWVCCPERFLGFYRHRVVKIRLVSKCLLKLLIEHSMMIMMTFPSVNFWLGYTFISIYIFRGMYCKILHHVRCLFHM